MFIVGCNMTKKELIKAMEGIGDDDVVIIEMSDGGWFNIDSVDCNAKSIRPDDKFNGIFSSDRD